MSTPHLFFRSINFGNKDCPSVFPWHSSHSYRVRFILYSVASNYSTIMAIVLRKHSKCPSYNVGSSMANPTSADSCMYSKSEDHNSTSSAKSMQKGLQLDYVNEDNSTYNTRGKHINILLLVISGVKQKEYFSESPFSFQHLMMKWPNPINFCKTSNMIHLPEKCTKN